MVKTLRKISFFILLILFTTEYPLSAGQYFSCDGMDYFDVESKCAEKQKQIIQEKSKNTDNVYEQGFTKDQIELWAEPSIDSSGKITSKLPPMPVMKLLAEPSEENAKKYIEWNQKRLDAISKMEKYISQVSGNQTAEQGIKDIKDIKEVIFYFSPT